MREERVLALLAIGPNPILAAGEITGNQGYKSLL
jgi:hypothetical protein